MRQTWYSQSGSKKAELWTILHLPYTLMCVAFFITGCGIQEQVNWLVLLIGSLAYFLGLQAAHFIDQLPSSKGTKYIKFLTPLELKVASAATLIIALILGVYLTVTWEAWDMLWLMPVQAFFVVAYPTSKPSKIFHSDASFAFSFGALPCLIGYYASSLTFSPIVIPFMVLAFLLSLQEITLSRFVRNVRKSGIDEKYYMKPELALKLLCVISYVLAFSVLIM